MPSVTAARPMVPVRPETAGRLAVLHLAPGIAAFAAYAAFARVTAVNSWPSILALAFASVLVEAPTAWLLMVARERAGGKSVSVSSLFPWNRPVRWSTYAFIGGPIMLFSLMTMAALNPVMESSLIHTVFSWVPDWFVLRGDPAALLVQSEGVRLILWVMALLMAVVGGGTQELYFRGYLLPRMEFLGARAPWLNAAGFAVFHLIAPWSWGVFFLVALPWSLLAWWKRSVRLVLFVHLGMLMLQWAILTVIVFGFVSIPA